MYKVEYLVIAYGLIIHTIHGVSVNMLAPHSFNPGTILNGDVSQVLELKSSTSGKMVGCI